jgi:hypothetical protein
MNRSLCRAIRFSDAARSRHHTKRNFPYAVQHRPLRMQCFCSLE